MISVLAMRSKLDEKKYQRLNTKETDMDANKFSNEHLDDIKLLLDAKNCISYKHYFQVNSVILYCSQYSK